MTILIDSITYDVPVMALREACDFLDKYAERAENGVLQRELIGTYHNYELEFGVGSDPDELAALWLKLTEAVEFHTVTVPDVSGTDYTFTAYFSNVTREARRVQGALVFWKNPTVHFIAQSPRRTP